MYEFAHVQFGFEYYAVCHSVYNCKSWPIKNPPTSTLWRVYTSICRIHTTVSDTLNRRFCKQFCTDTCDTYAQHKTHAEPSSAVSEPPQYFGLMVVYLIVEWMQAAAVLRKVHTPPSVSVWAVFPFVVVIVVVVVVVGVVVAVCRYTRRCRRQSRRRRYCHQWARAHNASRTELYRLDSIFVLCIFYTLYIRILLSHHTCSTILFMCTRFRLIVCLACRCFTLAIAWCLATTTSTTSTTTTTVCIDVGLKCRALEDVRAFYAHKRALSVNLPTALRALLRTDNDNDLELSACRVWHLSLSLTLVAPTKRVVNSAKYTRIRIVYNHVQHCIYTQRERESIWCGDMWSMYTKRSTNVREAITILRCKTTLTLHLLTHLCTSHFGKKQVTRAIKIRISSSSRNAANTLHRRVDSVSSVISRRSRVHMCRFSIQVMLPSVFNSTHLWARTTHKNWTIFLSCSTRVLWIDWECMVTYPTHHAMCALLKTKVYVCMFFLLSDLPQSWVITYTLGARPECGSHIFYYIWRTMLALHIALCTRRCVKDTGEVAAGCRTWLNGPRIHGPASGIAEYELSNGMMILCVCECKAHKAPIRCQRSRRARVHAVITHGTHNETNTLSRALTQNEFASTLSCIPRVCLHSLLLLRYLCCVADAKSKQFAHLPLSFEWWLSQRIGLGLGVVVVLWIFKTRSKRTGYEHVRCFE